MTETNEPIGIMICYNLLNTDFTSQLSFLSYISMINNIIRDSD